MCVCVYIMITTLYECVCVCVCVYIMIHVCVHPVHSVSVRCASRRRWCVSSVCPPPAPPHPHTPTHTLMAASGERTQKRTKTTLRKKVKRIVRRKRAMQRWMNRLQIIRGLLGSPFCMLFFSFFLFFFFFWCEIWLTFCFVVFLFDGSICQHYC